MTKTKDYTQWNNQQNKIYFLRSCSEIERYYFVDLWNNPSEFIGLKYYFNLNTKQLFD